MHNQACPYCAEARAYKRWITYARGCDGCASRLVAAMLRARQKQPPSIRTAKLLARGVPLDEVKGWM